MICAAENDLRTGTVARQVTTRIEELGPAAGVDADTLEQVAWAVEYFAQEVRPEGVVNTPEVVGWAAQALVGLGETQAARSLWLLGSGLVEYREDVGSGETPVWVLDLDALLPPGIPVLELTLLPRLGRAIEAMASCWDATNGRGTLALRHVVRKASQMAGQRAHRQKVMAAARDLVQACAIRLENLAVGRQWSATPHVLSLDGLG